MRPLALPFRVGTDICRIPRVYRILASARRGPRFVRRVLTAEERREPRCRAVLGAVLDETGEGEGGGAGRAAPGRVRGVPPARAPTVDPGIWKAAEFMAGR